MPKHPGKTPPSEAEKRTALLAFLRTLRDHPRPDMDLIASGLERASWKGVSCFSCAHCCRHMSPRYTGEDLRRIARHFRMSVKTVKEKWLQETENGWMNRSQPCPFLHLATNRCTIYTVRPGDCAGFPHLSASPMTHYLPTHLQNVSVCPATERFVQALQQRLEGDRDGAPR